MTLKELIAQINCTKGISRPSARELRDSGQIFVTATTESSILTVFRNGFAIYETGGRTTVIRADVCKSYQYEFQEDDGNDIPAEYFLEQDYSCYLMLIGEDRLQHNNDVNERRRVSYSFCDDEEERVSKVSVKSFEEELVEKETDHRFLELLYETLTEKQKKVYEMHFISGLTTRQIAKSQGIAQGSVTDCIARIVARGKKLAENF